MKRSPLKRKSKSERSKLTAQLDDISRAEVRARGRCQRCGSRDNLQAHHIILTSRSTFLRWEVRNMLCLCKSCHMWWHQVASVFAQERLVKACLTPEDENYIRQNEHTSGKFSVGELRLILDGWLNKQKDNNWQTVKVSNIVQE